MRFTAGRAGHAARGAPLPKKSEAPPPGRNRGGDRIGRHARHLFGLIFGHVCGAPPHCFAAACGAPLRRRHLADWAEGADEGGASAHRKNRSRTVQSLGRQRDRHRRREDREQALGRGRASSASSSTRLEVAAGLGWPLERAGAWNGGVYFSPRETHCVRYSSLCPPPRGWRVPWPAPPLGRGQVRALRRFAWLRACFAPLLRGRSDACT